MISSIAKAEYQLKKRFFFFKRKKRLNRSITGNIFVFCFIAILAVFMGLPLVYTLVNAFKPLNELFLFPPRFFVQKPTIDNFITMFQLTQNLWVPFSRYLFNSLFVAFLGTGVYVIIASLAAFPLAKHKFPGRHVFYLIIVWGILFRPEVTAMPQYIILSKMGMINTPFALILPALATSLGIFLMRQFMVSLPDQILEAARIDGASETATFWLIVMPAVKPAWLTLIIFYFQLFWNQVNFQYIYDERWKLLPAVLRQISIGQFNITQQVTMGLAVTGTSASASIARAGAGAAVALFLMIPPIVIYVVTQSSVLQTMTHSGIK